MKMFVALTGLPTCLHQKSLTLSQKRQKKLGRSLKTYT